MAMRQPHTMAVVVPDGRDRAGRVRYTHLTYRQLDQDSNRIAQGLKSFGIGRGTRAVVMVRPGLDFFSLVFALFKAGVVPVLIDPGIGLRNLGQCCREAEPEVFIGISKALWRGDVLGWGRGTVRQTILVGPASAGVLGSGFKTLDDVRRAGGELARPGIVPSASIALLGPEEPAAILFTSGSTGSPKGAVYTHAIFQAQVESFRSLYAIEPGEIDLCTFPLFALFAPALGMTAIVPDMDPTRPARANPAKIFEAIDDFGVTNMFGSPALLRRLAQAGKSLSMTAAYLEARDLGGRPSRPRSSNNWLPCSTGRLKSTPPMARPNRCPSHRSAAARFWRKPAMPPTRVSAFASAGPSRVSTSGSFGFRTLRFPPGPTTCSCPTAKSVRSSWPARS